MHSSRKSFVCSILTLYLLLGFVEYWQYMELNKELTKLEDKIVFLELQTADLEGDICELEGQIDELYDTCDSLDNYITILDKRVSALEVEKDSEEQIRDEIIEGEIEMLAQLIEAEAGNQDYIGKCLVADVVLNRVDSDIFPDSIEDVIMQHKIRKSDGVDCYQFSTVKYGSYDEAAWNISADSFAAARQEYESERLDGRVLYFTAGYYNPCCIPAYVHGDHYFGY